MSQIPLLSAEQFDGLQIADCQFELMQTKEAMDILGQVTPMLWIKIDYFEAHIPATLLRYFTLKCQYYIITPEFPAIATDRHAQFGIVNHYFKIIVKYVFCYEKIKHLLKVLFTQQYESQVEMFRVPQDVFQKLQYNAKVQTKKAFMALFKAAPSEYPAELSFFTDMREMLRTCQAELRTTYRLVEQAAKIKDLKIESAYNTAIKAYLDHMHKRWYKLLVFTVPTLEIAVEMLRKAEYWMDLAAELTEKYLKEGDNAELSERISRIEESLNMNYVLIKQFYDCERESAISHGYYIPVYTEEQDFQENAAENSYSIEKDVEPVYNQVAK